ncbi:MAG: LysR family transcriptional regulator, partial [Acidihalobacter sp.]
MDLKNLRYFVEVAQYGGFLKASRCIHVTQPALSKAVQQLEEELGTLLLIRSRPGVPSRLTPSGELVFFHAKALLERSAQMLNDVSLLNGLATGTLRLGLPPLGSTDQVAMVLTEFQQRFPQVVVQLTEQGGLELEEAVRKGEVELAVSLRPIDADLAWSPICREPLVVMLPPRHPLTNRHRLTLSDLAQQPWIRLEGASILNRRIEECCSSININSLQVAQSANLAFCLSLVAANAGLMVLPRLLAQHHIPPGVETVPLECRELQWQLAVIWRKDAQLSVAAQKW